MKLQINSYQNFNGLIPLSKYKGPILKLTKKEQAEIDAIQDELGKLILEKKSILDYTSSNNCSVTLYHKLESQIYVIDEKIKFLKAKIQEIKINRITKQRSKNV